MTGTRLSIADRVTMYRLIADSYPEEESGSYLEHRHALHLTVAGITTKHDTAEVQVQLAPVGSLLEQSPPKSARDHVAGTTGFVNANQPGFTEDSADLIGPAL